jgi:hypothetical protein
MTTAASETDVAAGHVAAMSGDLLQEAGSLRSAVETFLADVKAA